MFHTWSIWEYEKTHIYIYIYVCFNWDRARWKPSGIHVQVGITAMFLIFRWNYLLFVCSSILSVAEVMGKVTRWTRSYRCCCVS